MGRSAQAMSLLFFHCPVNTGKERSYGIEILLTKIIHTLTLSNYTGESHSGSVFILLCAISAVPQRQDFAPRVIHRLGSPMPGSSSALHCLGTATHRKMQCSARTRGRNCGKLGRPLKRTPPAIIRTPSWKSMNIITCICIADIAALIEALRRITPVAKQSRRGSNKHAYANK